MASFSALADQAITDALSLLLETGDTGGFVHVEESTQSNFTARRSSFSSCSIRVMAGDAKSPIGDGSATYHAYVACPGFKKLGVRIKYNQPGKYHIVGYWSE
ncbi:hypothetical protein [Thalassomonas sp. RHCl1]|uniref:hypothetical protein n=1 Tax=Thalassomonas sp. RHCl1 TaxID=2995320 RepID=UPI00248D0A9C|nr:hypothetical protein [Thalassomonas sp. RHCl1]